MVVKTSHLFILWFQHFSDSFCLPISYWTHTDELHLRCSYWHEILQFQKVKATRFGVSRLGFFYLLFFIFVTTNKKEFWGWVAWFSVASFNEIQTVKGSQGISDGCKLPCSLLAIRFKLIVRCFFVCFFLRSFLIAEETVNRLSSSILSLKHLLRVQVVFIITS